VKKPLENESLEVDSFVEVMGMKAKGKRLSSHPVADSYWLDPLPFEESVVAETEETEETEDNEEELAGDESGTEEENTTETKPWPEQENENNRDDDDGPGIQMSLF